MFWKKGPNKMHKSLLCFHRENCNHKYNTKTIIPDALTFNRAELKTNHEQVLYVMQTKWINNNNNSCFKSGA